VPELPADLPGRERRAVDVRIGPTSANRRDDLLELTGQDPLPETLRTTNVIERLHEAFRRRVKTQSL